MSDMDKSGRPLGRGMSEPDRKRALDSFLAIERGQNGAFEVVSYARRYKDAVPRAMRRSRVAMTTALRAI
jgi:hypothetical protein